MISSTVIKLSAPVARSSLIFISLGLLATSISIIHYAIEYPYLFGTDSNDLDKFYIQQSKPIAITFTIYSVVGILVALSTVYASYRGKAGYTLGHAGFIGIFVPAIIAAYFLTRANRHSPETFIDEGFVNNYRIDGKSKPICYKESDNPNKEFKEKVQLVTDDLQELFKCCGFHKTGDWRDSYDGFIPASCCEFPSDRENVLAKDRPDWAGKWVDLNENFTIEYCNPEKIIPKDQPGCKEAFKEYEDNKNDILALLTGLLGILCIADGVLSLLTYALIHTEHECKIEETELNEMNSGMPDADPANQLKPRSSISSNSGQINEVIAARALAVRFNLSNSPRNSISGPSKFSLAARRQSSYI